MAKNTKIKTGDDVIAPKKTRKPRAKVASKVKKTEEIKAEVKDVAEDVSEKLKAELEEVIAEKVQKAPVGSVWNKIFRNVIIVAFGVLVVAVVYNLIA